MLLLGNEGAKVKHFILAERKEKCDRNLHDVQGILCTFKGVNISVSPVVVCMHAITQLQAVLGRVMLCQSMRGETFPLGIAKPLHGLLRTPHVENAFSYS